MRYRLYADDALVYDSGAPVVPLPETGTPVPNVGIPVEAGVLRYPGVHQPVPGGVSRFVIPDVTTSQLQIEIGNSPNNGTMTVYGPDGAIGSKYRPKFMGIPMGASVPARSDTAFGALLVDSHAPGNYSVVVELPNPGGLERINHWRNDL